MNDETTLFPEHLSDEAAFALSEALNWLALTCDEKYFAQIRRHTETVYDRKFVDPDEVPW